jgi:hypothetical protein
VSFTEQGARTAAELDEGRGQLAELLFAGMPEAEFTGLVAGLDALLTRLRQELAAAGDQQ